MENTVYCLENLRRILDRLAETDQDEILKKYFTAYVNALDAAILCVKQVAQPKTKTEDDTPPVVWRPDFH